MSGFLEPGLISLKQAAAVLGCHVETLRLRVRRDRMRVVRGPHGEYFVSEDELDRYIPWIRFRKKTFDREQVEADVLEILHEFLANPAMVRPRHLELISPPDGGVPDLPLQRLLRVHALSVSGLRTSEIADHTGLSARHIQRLLRLTFSAAAETALERRAKAERGRVRRNALAIVRNIQGRLEAAGFKTARRNPKSSASGSRDGKPARTGLVHYLDRPTERHLLANGINQEQLAAIALVGIGGDELNELILRGLPN